MAPPDIESKHQRPAKRRIYIGADYSPVSSTVVELGPLFFTDSIP